MSYNILVSPDEGFNNSIIDDLKYAGANAAFASDNWEESFCSPEDIDVILGNRVLEKYPLEMFPNLKFLQVMNAGMDNIPVEAIHDRGIMLSNGRGLLSPYIAEWILTQVLCSAKCTEYFKEKQKEHEWVRGNVEAPVITLVGKTACIVGFGSIGQETAKRLKAFGMRVIALNRSPIQFSEYIDESYSLPEKKLALSRSDVVAITIPLTKDTENLICKEALGAMKDDAILINASRGAVLDEDALIELLFEGKFRRVALDVFQTEPLPKDSPLWDFENVVVSPHESPLADGLNEKRQEFATENMIRFIQGEEPWNLY